jgi:hypothetical protein
VPTAVEKPPEPVETFDNNGIGSINYQSPSADELGLTEEDVLYLQLKWGRAYKPEEWVKLE